MLRYVLIQAYQAIQSAQETIQTRNKNLHYVLVCELCGLIFEMGQQVYNIMWLAHEEDVCGRVGLLLRITLEILSQP